MELSLQFLGFLLVSTALVALVFSACLSLYICSCFRFCFSLVSCHDCYIFSFVSFKFYIHVTFSYIQAHSRLDMLVLIQPLCGLNFYVCICFSWKEGLQETMSCWISLLPVPIARSSWCKHVLYCTFYVCTISSSVLTVLFPCVKHCFVDLFSRLPWFSVLRLI